MLIAVMGFGQVASPDLLSNAEPAPILSGEETFRARVDEVNVVFTVSDASGRFVSKLSLNDLNVLDNRRAPERISYFQQQSDLPLRVAVLVDQSESVADRFIDEKKAAVTFLKTVLRPQVDQAFVVGFGSRVVWYRDFTADIQALSKAVWEMRAGGDTRLYDAIQYAAAKLERVSGPQAVRRAIILITDGEDTRSRAIMYDAIQSALRAETVIFALSSNDLSGGRYPHGEAVLELMTHPTGGSVLAAHSRRDMERAFGRVKDALRNQYVVAYKPADMLPDGNFRTIEIVPRQTNLHVQCRRGYFAPRSEQERWSGLRPRCQIGELQDRFGDPIGWAPRA